MMERFLPNFESLEPSILMKSLNKIKESKYYNKNQEYNKPNKNKFMISYNKLKSGEDLISKDFKILAYYIDYLIKGDTFYMYKGQVYKNIDNMIGIRGLVRPLVSYIYSNKSDYENDVYSMLKIVLGRIDRSKFKDIREFSKERSPKVFKEKICNEFKNLRTMTEINEKMDRFFIKQSDKFYHNIIAGFIANNHKNKELFKWSKSILNSMDITLKNKIFEEIILCYKDIILVEEYPEEWFFFIRDILGEPYATVKNRWADLDQRCKEIFRKWFNSKSIHEFFTNEVAGGDRRRLEFWKKYIDEIYRIKYIKDANKALLMEFKNHLFIEFAQVSNATYVYKKSVYNIDKIEQKIDRKVLSSGNLMLKVLKDPYLAERKLTHRLYWEDEFESYISGIGYDET